MPVSLRDPLDTFADREDILTLFRQFLHAAHPGQFRLLAIKGNSGTGKTFLVEYLANRVCPALKWQTGQMNFALDFRPILAGLEDAFKNCVPRNGLQQYRTKRDKYNDSFDEYRTSITVNQSVEAREYSSVAGVNLSVQINAELQRRELQLRAEWTRALIELSEESFQPLCLFIDGYVSPPGADFEFDKWLWEEVLLKLARAAPQPLLVVTCGWEWPSNATIEPLSYLGELDEN